MTEATQQQTEGRPLRVTFTPGYGESLRASFEGVWYSWTHLFWFSLFPLAGVFLIGTVLLMDDLPPQMAAKNLIVGALAILCWPFYIVFQLWSLRRKPIYQGSFTFGFDEEGLKMEGPGGSSNLKWLVIQRFAETNSSFLFYLSTNQTIFIPKHALEKEGILEAVRDLVLRQMAAKK